jgi:Fe-S-cluster containining protein|tara:strand:- start:1278 stop:2135 length:858 start_codon:yes stop_codon:yes gene_type:complete
MITTKLNLEDKLPLTCSRTGTCCHGKTVWLNPWELALISREKKISRTDFIEQFCDFGGIKLKFEGEKGWKDLKSCSQYIPNFGCSVHLGRPLACRLYPLGRQIQSEKVHYIHEGKEFPCLEGCPEVVNLPFMTVSEYIQDQSAGEFEKSQDNHLELMQQLANIAFELFLDTGLAQSGDTETLNEWIKLGEITPDELNVRIGKDWLNALVLPEIESLENPTQFTNQHTQLLLAKAQEQFGTLITFEEVKNASILIMGVALQLSRSFGADPKSLSIHWVEAAKSHLQ